MPPKGWKKPPTPVDHSDTLVAIVHELRLALRDLQERYEQAETRHQQERQAWSLERAQLATAPFQRVVVQQPARRHEPDEAVQAYPDRKDLPHIPRDLSGDIAAMRIANADFKRSAEAVLVAEPPKPLTES